MPRGMQLHQGAAAVNQLGGHFVNGCPLPDFKRKWIIDLAASGLRATDISRHLKVSNGCVSKILTRFYQMGVVQPKAMGGSRPRLSTPQVVARVAQMKQEQPSLFAWEIRGKLQAEGLCAAGRMPSVSSINRILRTLPLGVHFPDQFAFLTKPLQPDLPLPGERRPEGSAEAPASRSSPRRTEEGIKLPTPWNQHKSKTVFSKQQREVLEEAFQRGQYPEAATREKLASTTRLPNATIRVWFSNRRARWRREAKKALDTHHTGSALRPMVPEALGLAQASKRPSFPASACLAQEPELFQPHPGTARTHRFTLGLQGPLEW
ncbi:paired box protein Pax-4 [Elgaria multicarinata webbii]|uniref:paired box protein Pax-4 n=1 Tax=Elgaria multicarinata webbii TaxID=159646 RepID=UPI002FCD5C58